MNGLEEPVAACLIITCGFKTSTVAVDRDRANSGPLADPDFVHGVAFISHLWYGGVVVESKIRVVLAVTDVAAAFAREC